MDKRILTKTVVNTTTNPIILGYYIFRLRSKYPNIKDHSLIAYLIKERFKVNITKEDIDEYYGFNDIITECYEDESRIHEYKLKLI